MPVSHPLLGAPRGLARVSDAVPWWRRVDVALVGSTIAIALSGLLMVLSATRSGYGEDGYTGLALRQAMWIFIGLGVMVTVASIDPRRFQMHAAKAYGAAIFLLLAVLSPLGSEVKGAQAWFTMGSFQFQPAEATKLVVIVALASYLARQTRGLSNVHVAVAVAIAALPIGLILLQPDLGTVLVFGVIALIMLLVGGAPPKSIVALLAAVVVVAFLVVQLGVLKQYQLDRLGAFLDPTSNTQQAAYNLNQSKIAIGSGQIDGKGLFLGTQTNLRYVPEQHTDFIFTVVGEELGLLGAATLLTLFAVLTWRIWAAARDAATPFTSYVCAGVLAMIVFQVFENVGMTMGIMPITGIPLPLVSYGGSSMLVTFAALGLVLGIQYRSRT